MRKSEEDPEFDACVRCHKVVEEDGLHNHCSDGEYMCNECVHKAPLQRGDFCYVQNKQYRGGDPDTLDPPGLIVRFDSIRSEDKTKARRHRCYWWKQVEPGSLKTGASRRRTRQSPERVDRC